MHLPFYALPGVGVTLEGVLLWRLTKLRLERYPYLSGFVFYDFVRCFILFAVSHFQWERYGMTYWSTEIVSVFLRFLVIWEVARSLFSRNSVIQRLAWKMLITMEVVLLPALLALGWSQASLVHYLYKIVSPIFEQYLSLGQALLLLTLAAVARYYGVPLGRNMRGLIFGFGTYLSLCAINFASLQVFRGFLRYWQLLCPVTFVAMIVVWLWAFWEYTPSPELARIDEAQCVQRKAEWNHLWITTMKALKRGLG